MPFREKIRKLIDEQQVEQMLTHGSKAKEEIQALQTILYELGFEQELNWNKYGADGIYGDSTAKAVKAFGNRNGFPGDGETVSLQIAEKLIARFDILDDMRYLYSIFKEGDIGSRIYYGSPDTMGITALQTLLNELGFGASLNWEESGADGLYGKNTAAAVALFSQLENIKCPEGRLTNPLTARIISKLEGFLGTGWAEPPPSTSTSAKVEITITTTENLTMRERKEGGKSRVYISDGVDEVLFTRFKKGLYSRGKQKPLEVIHARTASLKALGLTGSAVNVMIALSENQSNLDAVNTWDNFFLTFGMFQWTIGAGNEPGELAALLTKIKTADQDVFYTYYGQYGLDIELIDNISGYLILEGQKLISLAEKQRLRTYDWAFYFWKSGQDPLVQVMQIIHAFSRVKTFYRNATYEINGYYISDLITSEYGVGLILDHHANRPGYVKSCLKEAMKRANLFDPVNWGTGEEMQLIDAYLKVRDFYGKYPLPDADKRAAVIKKYLDNRTISAERGSFQYDP